jgi:hypothetical protein
LRESGRYEGEITCTREMVWFDTFDWQEEPTYAYNAIKWRFVRPERELNFPDVEG